MTCPECGIEIDPDSKICANCGKKVVSDKKSDKSADHGNLRKFSMTVKTGCIIVMFSFMISLGLYLAGEFTGETAPIPDSNISGQNEDSAEQPYTDASESFSPYEEYENHQNQSRIDNNEYNDEPDEDYPDPFSEDFALPSDPYSSHLHNFNQQQLNAIESRSQ